LRCLPGDKYRGIEIHPRKVLSLDVLKTAMDSLFKRKQGPLPPTEKNILAACPPGPAWLIYRMMLLPYPATYPLDEVKIQRINSLPNTISGSCANNNPFPLNIAQDLKKSTPLRKSN
jgi:hypothetical protein